jgi:excisionase family DNA binding protein
MTIASSGVDAVVPAHLERRQLRDLARALRARGKNARLVTSSGEEHEIPEAVRSLLAQVVDQLAEGNSVTVAPATKQLTTQQAADILGVSRPYLVKLLEENKLPHHRVGSHRRVALVDVVSYKDKQKQERRAAMEDLARASLDAGLEV